MPPGYYVWDSFGRCTARLLECSSESFYPNPNFKVRLFLPAVRVVAVYSIEKNPLALLLHETRNPCVAQSPDLIKKTKVEETC